MNRRSSLTALALAGAALILAWPHLRPAGAAPPPRAKVEYKLLAWSPEDTLAVLREVTGDDVSEVRDLIAKLDPTKIEPRDNPKLQAAVDRRLESKLAKLGVRGWEAFWVRDTTTVLDGHVLPAPAVLLKRRP